MFDLYTIIDKCAPEVAPTTMERILTIESGKIPHMIGYNIRKNGKVYILNKQPKNNDEAIRLASWLYINGYSFDAGIAQINSMHFKSFGISLEKIFDQCENIKISSKILSNFYLLAKNKYGETEKAILAAVSAYNSGSFDRGFKNGYVRKFKNANINIRKKFNKKIFINLHNSDLLWKSTKVFEDSYTKIDVADKNPYTASMTVNFLN